MKATTDFFSTYGLEIIRPQHFIYFKMDNAPSIESKWVKRYWAMVYKIKRRKAIINGILKVVLFVISLPITALGWLLALVALPKFIMQFPLIGVLWGGLIFITWMYSWMFFGASFETDPYLIKIKRHGRKI